MSPDTQTAKRIVLLGAGHTHLLAIPQVRRAWPDARIVLVDPAPVATYSGLVPGCIAGHYRAEQAQVDLRAFADRHGVDLILAAACGISADAVELAGGGQIAKGAALSLDIGSHSAMPEIMGFAHHAIPVKPLGAFLPALSTAFKTPQTPVVLIGGGVAGTEIAMAIAHRHACPVTIIEGGPMIAPGLAPNTRARLQRALSQRGIRIITGRRVINVTADGVELDDATIINAGLVIGAAGARAYGWLADHLPTDTAGFIRVTPDLRIEGMPTSFATGDCAAMIHTPRPKAGVYAVRQAPILAHNLVAAVQGSPMRRFDPQADYLKLISLGERKALGEWRGFSAQGHWIWRIKDHIDRGFVAGLQAKVTG